MLTRVHSSQLQFSRNGSTLVAAEPDAVTLVDLRSDARRRIAVAGVQALAAFADQVWVATRSGSLVRFGTDARRLDEHTLSIDPDGSLIPTMIRGPSALWAAREPVLLLDDLGSLAVVPCPSDTVIPIAGRRFVRHAGPRFSLPAGTMVTLESAAQIVGGSVIFDGISLALVTERPGGRDIVVVALASARIRQTVALPLGTVRIAARRGLAVAAAPAIDAGVCVSAVDVARGQPSVLERAGNSSRRRAAVGVQFAGRRDAPGHGHHWCVARGVVGRVDRRVRIVAAGDVVCLACGVLARRRLRIVAAGGGVRRAVARDLSDAVDGCEREPACRLKARAAGDGGGGSRGSCRLRDRKRAGGSMMPDASTMTVPRRSWRIRDAVLRLREHGTTDRVYGRPVPPVACRMGTSGDLQLQLLDPSGTVSREHAEIVPVEIDGERLWKIHDLKLENGLCCDGEPLRACVLRPGLEVRLGSLRLIAESMELIGLLSVVRRCLGSAAERQELVDQALQSLRGWAAQRAELVVVGDGDLRPVVRRLHNLVIGADVPFTWYEPDGAPDAAAAVKAAVTGTLCVDTMDRQAEALAVVERIHGTEYIARPQLVLCTADPTSAATLKGSLERPAVIQVPPLASRASELEDIVQEYAWGIAREQRLPRPELQDLEQLGRWPFRSLAEVEDDVLRLVTLRTWGLAPGCSAAWDWSQLAALVGAEPGTKNVMRPRRRLLVEIELGDRRARWRRWGSSLELGDQHSMRSGSSRVRQRCSCSRRSWAASTPCDQEQQEA